jgi:hypothetical protein
MTDANYSARSSHLTLVAIATLAFAAGCGTAEGGTLALWRGKADSIAAVNSQLEDASADKDTVIESFQVAMSVAGELDQLEREVGGKSAGKGGKGAASRSLDARMHSEIVDIRDRHRALIAQLATTTAHVKELSAKNATLAANLAGALQTIDSLQAQVARQDARIQELVAQVGGLQSENLALVTEANRVYWIAGTEDSLRALGIIKPQGGKRLLVIKVGGTFVPGDTLDPARFHAIDKSRDDRVVLPDSSAEYEIVSPQNIAYVAAVLPNSRRVKGRFAITNPKFWDNSKFLILLRR